MLRNAIVRVGFSSSKSNCAMHCLVELISMCASLAYNISLEFMIHEAEIQ